MNDTTVSVDRWAKQKENHARISIFVWFAFGLFALLTGKLKGISTASFILFWILFPTLGVFIASFGSILTYLPKELVLKLWDKGKVGINIRQLTSGLVFIINIFWIIFLAGIFISFFIPKAKIVVSSTPIRYQKDKQAFIDSITELNQARDLSNNMNGQDPAKLYVLVDKGLAASERVSDDYLDYLNPELKSMYRDKLIAGTELWYQGVKDNDSGDKQKGLREQLDGDNLVTEWISWFEKNKNQIGSQIF